MQTGARARELLGRIPLIDGHNDLPWQLWQKAGRSLEKADLRAHRAEFQTDIPRLRAGGVGAQFWSVYVPCSVRGDAAVRATLEQIDVVYRMCTRYPDVFGLARSAAEVERLRAGGRIASLIGMEGGHCIDGSLATLRMFHRLGARYLTLTHSDNVPWADSATDEPVLGGLDDFGEEVVRELNRLGMLVDLSHASTGVMEDALRVSAAPVVFTHSSARSLCDHVRNVPDEVLGRLADNGGVVMVTFVPSFVSESVRAHAGERAGERDRLERSVGAVGEEVEDGLRAWDHAHPRPVATLADVADHIDRVRDVAGIDHAGIGADFDGIPYGPEGLEDVSRYPCLVAELMDRGYSDDDVAKVAGRNVLRVMRAAEDASGGDGG